MRLESAIGELEIKLEKVVREGNELVVLSKTGIWDARIYIEKSDIKSILKVSLCRAALRFFFSSLLSRRKQKENDATSAK